MNNKNTVTILKRKVSDVNVAGPLENDNALEDGVAKKLKIFLNHCFIEDIL
jgi:phosphotransacetylase